MKRGFGAGGYLIAEGVVGLPGGTWAGKPGGNWAGGARRGGQAHFDKLRTGFADSTDSGHEGAKARREREVTGLGCIVMDTSLTLEWGYWNGG